MCAVFYFYGFGKVSTALEMDLVKVHIRYPEDTLGIYFNILLKLKIFNVAKD